jgi:hypothetical protein
MLRPMIDDEGGSPAVFGLLDDLNVAGPAELMPVLLERLRTEVGVIGLRLLVVDLDESRLEDRRVLSAGVGLAEGAVSLADSPQGAAYRSGVTQVVEHEGKTMILAPITARQVREGVLEVLVDRTGVTDRDVDIVRSGALLLGYTINAADRWTDEFHVTRRLKEMTLPAEMQWGQLPLGAFATEQVSLAGSLEPAYEVGGDSFDYACDADRLSAGVFDAMGHGLTAARLSTFGIATYRNARRRGDDIAAQAATLHDALRPAFDREGFMTAVMVQIDLTDPGRSSILRAGHHAPILQRAGETPVVLDVQGGLPFGMPFDETVPVGPLALQPGDRLVLFSDGVVEARPEGGDAYGLDPLVRQLETLRDASPREATRRVTRAVREHRSADLADDATILMIDILPRD